MTKERRNARARQKYAEGKAEAARLYAQREQKLAQEQKAYEEQPGVKRQRQQYEEQLAKIHEMLFGSEFKAWYEATTGEDVEDFLQDYINRFYYTRGDKSHQFDWIKNSVEGIALKNPWTNPEQRPYWAEQVQNATDPRQRRIILQRLATPRWANQEKIVQLYLERDRLTEETGIPHEVDHVVPIVNQNVCGLHVEFNLRVISKFENRTKSNKFNNELLENIA